MKLPNAQVRQYLYGVLIPGLGVLMGYGIIDGNQAALWLSLGGAVLGLGTATIAVTKQRRDGTLD